MPALVVGGTTIPRVMSAPRTQIEAIDRQRAYDNTMLAVQIGTTKKSWSILASHVTTAQLATIESALASSPPVTCSGDMLGGSVSCHIEVHSVEPILGILPRVWNISFTLHQV